MNAGQLDPVIERRLHEFRRRRRKLILSRGLLDGLAALFAVAAAVAAADFLWVLSDRVRFVLTFAGYALVLLCLWNTCLSSLLRRMDLRKLARYMESGRPELREDLLSAVELGESHEPAYDSEAFRELLQRHVAVKMADLDVSELLSYRLIRRAFVAAGLALVFAVVLLLLPNLDFGRLAVRALWPGANLARVSIVRVVVMEPSPPDAILPRGDLSPITVAVSGGRVQAAVLETAPRPGAKGERTPMDPVSPRRFSSAVKIEEAPLWYRVRAGDAVTRWYALTSSPRPRVLQFAKTYHYPDYTGREAEQVEEDHGDLTGLQGAHVELALRTDQAVRRAELHLSDGIGEDEVIVLETTPEDGVQGTVPLTRDCTYKVHLVSAETGFENTFSPRYEIRAQADLVPRVRLEEPREDLVAGPDDVMRLAGAAEDDLGLDVVSQAFRINREDWQEVALAARPGTEARVARAWDLAELELLPGDRLETRLVATDLKGNRSESVIRRIAIAASALTLGDTESLEAQRRAGKEVQRLADRIEDLKRRVREAATQDDETEPIEQQRRHAAAAVASAEAQRQMEHTWDAVKQAVAEAADPGAERDTVLLGRLVSRLRREELEPAMAELAGAPGGMPNRQVLEAVADRLDAAAQDARLARTATQRFIAEQEGAAAVDQLARLQSEQRRVRQALDAAGEDESSRERLRQRQQAVADAMMPVDDLLGPLADRVQGDLARKTRDIRERLAEAHAEAAAGVELRAFDSGTDAADRVQDALEAAASHLAPVSDRLRKAASDTRAALRHSLGDAHKPLESLASQVRGQAEAALQSAWTTAARRLSDAAELEEQGARADAEHILDLSMASDAVAAVSAIHATNLQAAAAAAQVLDEAMETLGAAQVLEEVTRAADDFAWAESPSERTFAPADRDRPAWEYLADRLDQAPAAAQDLPLSRELTGELTNLPRNPVSRAMAREMAHRGQTGHASQPLSGPARELQRPVREALTAAAPEIESARATLASLAPRLSDQMRNLAQQAEDLAEAAVDVTASETDGAPPPALDQLDPLETAHDQLAEDLSDLKDRVRRDANAQDLSAEPGRLRARIGDVALAMLRPEPEQSAADLSTARIRPEARRGALTDLAGRQASLADNLGRLADRYEADPSETPAADAAWAEAEAELGLGPILDDAYERAAALAEWAHVPTAEALVEALEQELARSESMQDALEGIAARHLREAEQALAQAAAAEAAYAEDLERVGDTVDRETPGVTGQASSLAAQAAALARDRMPAVADAALAAEVPLPDSYAERQAELGYTAGDLAGRTPASTVEHVGMMEELLGPLRATERALEETARRAASASDAAMQTAAEADLTSQEATARHEAAEAAARYRGQSDRQELQSLGQAAEAAAAASHAASRRAQHTQVLAGSSQSAAAEASRLAQQAEGLARGARRLAGQEASTIGEAAAGQPGVADAVLQAAAQVNQASRHQARLGNAPAPGAADLPQQLHRLGDVQLPATERSLAQAQQAAEAYPPVQQAALDLQAAEAALGQTVQGLPSVGSTPGQDAGAEVGQWLAQALDQADQATASGAPPSSAPAMTQAQSAAQAAANAHAASLSACRAQGAAPGQRPDGRGDGQGSGAAVEVRGREVVTALQSLGDREAGSDAWARLPRRVARDLRDGLREEFPPEYREMLRTYYRVLAERSRTE